MPFDLGLAIGLGALLLARRGRLTLALAASVLTRAGEPRRRRVPRARVPRVGARRARDASWPAALAVAALAPIGLLALAFPEGGSQPFVASAFYPALVGRAGDRRAR